MEVDDDSSGFRRISRRGGVDNLSTIKGSLMSSASPRRYSTNQRTQDQYRETPVGARGWTVGEVLFAPIGLAVTVGVAYLGLAMAYALGEEVVNGVFQISIETPEMRGRLTSLHGMIPKVRRAHHVSGSYLSSRSLSQIRRFLKTTCSALSATTIWTVAEAEEGISRTISQE